jgi:hypothetical protein
MRQHIAQATLETAGAPPLPIELPHQGPVLAYSRRRPPGLGQFVGGEKFGQDLRVQTVRLAAALGNDAHLSRMNQHDPIGLPIN